MQQPVLAESVLQALQNLQEALLESAQKQKVASNDANGLNNELSKLSSCLHDLLRRHAVLEQSVEDRSIAEKALRNVLANKEAEAARLRSEISRLRHSLLAKETAAAVADSAAQAQPSVSQTEAAAAALLEPAARQALLDAAVIAKEKPLAAVLQLESEVAACRSRIADLEIELAAAAAENTSRLAEQQKAFMAKLEQLRQVHRQQLASAVAQVQGQLQQQQDHCRELQQQLAAARQSSKQQQVEIASLQQLLQEHRTAQQSRPSGTSSKNNTIRLDDEGHRKVPHSISIDSSSSRQQPSAAPSTAAAADSFVEQRISSRSATPHSAEMPVGAAACDANQPTEGSPSTSAAALLLQAGAEAEASALQLMEGQLARLSGIIRCHQEEITELNQALMAGCAERQQLQQQLQHALVAQQQQQQQQQLGSGCGVPSVLAGGGGGGGGGSSSSSGSRRRSSAVPSKAVKVGAAPGGMLAGITQQPVLR